MYWSFCFELNLPCISTFASHPRVVSEYARRHGLVVEENKFNLNIPQEPAYYQPDEKPGPKKEKASKLVLKLIKGLNV